MKARLYTKDKCPFCVNAKALLTLKGIEYEEIEIGKDITREQFFDIIPEAKTVPQIFLIEGDVETKVGGYTDLVNHLG